MSAPLARSVRVGYPLGSFATGAFGTVPGLLLLPYLTDSLGVAAGLAGALVLLPKVWDVIFNPIAGRISDRTVTKIGPRRPFVVWGGLAAGILFMLIFAGVMGTSRGAPVWVVGSFILCATAYAFFQVPYCAMPAEITDDERERSGLLTGRVAVIAFVILVCGALAPMIANGNADRIAGYRAMGVFVGAFFIIGGVGTFIGTRRAPVGTVGRSESLRAQLRVAAANKPYLVLLVCFIIQGAGIATILAGVNYFAEQVTRTSLAGTVLFAAFIAPVIIFMPMWSRIGRRTGNLRGFVIASLLFTLGGLLITVVGFVAGTNLVLAGVAVAVIGVGYAGEQVFALAMLADCIAADTARTGVAQGGVFAGIWTAGETLGYALGPGVFSLFLQFSGYISTTAGHTVVQPPSAAVGIILGFGIAPAVLMAGGLILLRWYHAPATDKAAVAA